MQEYSSISVSSYEAGALAERLTEQSRDGWAVVAIVPTGSTVTAYLSRATDGTTVAASTAPATAEPAASGTSTHDADHADPAPSHDDAAVGDDDEPDEPAASETTSAGTDDEPAASSVSDAPGWAAGASGAAVSPTVTDATPGEAIPDTTAAGTETESAVSTPAATPAGAAAPAGWYADPSARFELRYWDGGQWTEHVSRAGQQYTDPPVA